MVLLYLALALAVTGATPIPWLRVDEAPLKDELQIIGAGENDDNQVLQANQDKTFNAAQDKINASVTHILFEWNTTQDWENKSTTATGPGLTNATNMEQKENSNEIGNSSNVESLNNTIFISDENEDLQKPRGEEFEKKMRIACFAILGTIIAITVVVFIWIGKRSYDYYLRPQPIKDITRNSEMKKNDFSSGEKELQNSRESEECTEVDTNVPMPECLQIPKDYEYGERQSIENTGEHEKPHNYQEREDKICEELSGNQDVNGNKKMVKEENNTGCQNINENSQVIRSLTSGENQGKTKFCIDKTFSGNQETLQTQAVCGNQGTCESRATCENRVACKNRAVCENQAIYENQATYEIRVVSEYPRTHENQGTYGNQRVSEDTVAISKDQGAPEDQGASEDQEASECHETSEDQESSDYNKASKDPRTSENLDDSKDQRTCENQADSEDQRTCEDKGYSEKLGASGDEESFGHQGSYEYQGASEDKRASEVQEIPEAQGSLEDLEAFKDQRASEDQGAPGNKGAPEDERTSEDQGAPEDQGSSEDQGACEDQKASEYQGTSEDLGTFKNQTVSENEAVCQYNADSKNQISCEYAVGSENQAASGNEEPFENQKDPYIQVALVFSHSVSSDSQATLESQVTLANPVTLKDQEALKKQLLLENQEALEMEVVSKYLECLESSNDETENVTENERETVEDDQYCQEELKGLSVHQEEGAIPYNLNCRMLHTYQEGLTSEKVEVDQEFLVSADISQCQE